MIDLPLLITKVEAIARSAGAFLRQEQKNFSQDRVSLKSLNALVSDVDKNTEKQLVRDLRALLPEAGFLTEEGTTRQATSDEYYWVIDPLDGTTNFVHGLPIYSVSIALMHNDEPILGVVYEVGMDECFSAYKDGGATLNGKKITTSSTSNLSEALLATGFPYYDFTGVDGFQETLAYFYPRTRGIRRIGTAAVDLAYTACGRFEAYFEYGLSPWDVAAGILLVREAGGQVCDYQGGNAPIDSKSIIASNNGVFGDVLKVIQSTMGNG
jgi:myo-inositol-1(or 4)-monophosphatase